MARRLVGAEIGVQVLDLAGHIAGETRFNAGARRPAPAQRAADEFVAGDGIGDGVEARPYDGAQVLDLAVGKATGHIGQRTRRDSNTQSRPRTVPNQSRLCCWIRLTGASKPAMAGLQIAPGHGAGHCALVRELHVGLDTRQPHAALPIVADRPPPSAP